MDQQKIIDEINYYRAQILTRLLFENDLITAGECDKLTELNRASFSPSLADLLPKTLEKSRTQS